MSQMNQRQALTAMAHILAEKVGLHGESYRMYLLCLTGKTSCSDCDLEALQRFVDALMLQVNGVDPRISLKKLSSAIIGAAHLMPFQRSNSGKPCWGWP